MRSFYVLLAVTVSFFIHSKTYSQAYTLDWGSSFSPALAAGNTSGTATAINGSSRNLNLSMNFTGAGNAFIA
ncbi:MAG TPA: hypothetical protein VHK91_14370, partial [Flavisolibacter sp.]|nr:hypothetical protein [Flavisolibacter sp.]